ncbi:GroES-like protein [Xylaria intraflava]|nr:GroES-like protein [Xylaria intraflava]
MATAKTLVIVERGKVEIRELPLPKVRDDSILVRIRATGINPTDRKSIDSGDETQRGSRPGCDYAGEVVEVGAGVTKGFKKGDRVSGLIFGSNSDTPDNGAFGEYATAREHISLKTPDNVSDEEGATLGVSVTTVGQGLYKTLKLPPPNKPAETPFPVLIYGGSSATGIYGIKFAKLSGLTVIATASPHNFGLLKSIGADYVFDYKSPTVGADIRALTGNKLKYAWDCIGGPSSAAICAAALSDDEEGGRPKYANIVYTPREAVERVNPVVDGPLFTLAYTVVGEGFTRFGKVFEPDLEDAEFAGKFWDLTLELLASGRLTPLRPDVNRLGRGLEGIILGLDEVRHDRVSGTKLVYTL